MSKHKLDTTKERAAHRIKIIKGHLNKIEKMIANDEYCVDIVHQSKAVQSALKKLDLLLIEDHLSHCVVDQIRNNEEQRTTDELLKLFEYK
jgi:DNA-binding FrmR family transcriptional regulator